MEASFAYASERSGRAVFKQRSRTGAERDRTMARTAGSGGVGADEGRR